MSGSIYRSCWKVHGSPYGLQSVSLVIGLAAAIPLALARLAKNPFIASPAYVFVLYFRGTPLLVQIFLIYYGSGQFRLELTDLGLWGFFRDPWFCGILALVLNTAAYSAEIFRGAITAVPRNDIEAGRACGMSGLLLFRRITLPKAFRIGLPAYGNEVIFLLQATSLVSTITILDLTGISRQLISKTFAVYEFYLTAAAMYLDHDLCTGVSVSSVGKTHERALTRKSGR